MLRQLGAGQLPAALLFDLDGTLLDSAPDLAAAVDGMLEASGLPVANEMLVRSWIGNGALKLVNRALAHSQNCHESDITGEQLNAAHQLFLTHYGMHKSRYSRLYPGVLDALQVWQGLGIKMALVTNKPEQFVPPLLEHFGIATFFSVLVGGDTLNEKKPAAEPLLYACDQLGVPVTRSIMVGDSCNDVEAARAASMPVVCVSYGYNHGEPVANAKPDLLVDSLLELAG